MHVYRVVGEVRSLIGTAEVPPECGPIFEVHLFNASQLLTECYTVGTVTHLHGDRPPDVERVILLGENQTAELLPGWRRFQS